MMPMTIPYLTEEQIECDAARLLAEYEQARGTKIARAVPIEEIVEKHLKLGLEFDDMHTLLGYPHTRLGPDPDILGAIFFEERRIVIDESLDPEEHPTKEGRFRFTLAHEGGGHWRLHRHLFTKHAQQASFFSEPASPSLICRSGQAKAPVEWQADFYASCLLMPRRLVFAAWCEMFPDQRPRIIAPPLPLEHPFVEVRRLEYQVRDLRCSETDENVLDRVARPLAEQFLVSATAMRIRLEKLGLLLRQIPDQRVLTGVREPYVWGGR